MFLSLCLGITLLFHIPIFGLTLSFYSLAFAIRHSPPRTTGKTRPNVWTSISQKEVNIPDSLFLATPMMTIIEVGSILVFVL